MASTIAPPYLWTVSARSKESLREAVTRDATFLRDAGKSLGELAATVQRRRSHHPHRLVIVADDKNEAARRLANWTGDSDMREAIAGHAREDARDVVFVFSGQGGQWPGMGRKLFERGVGCGKAGPGYATRIDHASLELGELDQRGFNTFFDGTDLSGEFVGGGFDHLSAHDCSFPGAQAPE